MTRLLFIVSFVHFSFSMTAQDKTPDLYKKSLEVYLKKVSLGSVDTLNEFMDGEFVVIPAKLNHTSLKMLNETFFKQIQGVDTTFEMVKLMPLKIVEDYL